MFARTVLLLALLAPAALADEDPRPAAAERARHVADAVKKIYEATERLDVEPAVEFLYDEDWLVRRYAIVRLRATGLPDDLYDGFLRHAAPAGPGVDEEASALIERIETWVGERDEEPLEGDFAATDLDAAIGVFGIVREALSHPVPGGEARRMVDLSVATAERLKGDDRRLAGDILLGSFGATARKELEIPPEKRNLEAADVERLVEWYWKNRPWFYLHRRAHGLRLDAAAREAGQPTDAWRAEHPWGEGEGPEAPIEGEPEGGIR